MATAWYQKLSGLWLPKLDFSQPHPHPCPNCCERFSGCQYFWDTFSRDAKTDVGDDWDEVAGDWEISAAKEALLTDDSNAICKCEEDNPLSETAVVAYAWLATSDTGNQIRLIVNYEDSDNYWFVQWEREATTGSLKLYERSGGVETQRGLTVSSSGLDVNSVQLHVCMFATGIESTYRFPGSATIYRGPSYMIEDSTSAICAIGTGTVSSDIWVYSFSLTRHRTEDDSCAECGGICSYCSNYPNIYDPNPPTPNSLLARFEGFTNDEDCDQCESYYNDTFALVQTDRCYFDYTVSPAVCNRQKIRALPINLGAKEFWVVRLQIASGSYPWSPSFYTDNLDCSSWDDEECPWLGPDGGEWCDAANAICYLTAVP